MTGDMMTRYKEKSAIHTDTIDLVLLKRVLLLIRSIHGVTLASQLYHAHCEFIIIITSY